MDKFLASEKLLDYTPFPKSLPTVNKEEYSAAFLTYVAGKVSLLPELATLLPFDTLVNFLYAFAGQTIEVPDQKTIENAIRDINIYFNVANNPSSDEIKEIAKRYSMPVQSVSLIVKRVSKALGKENPIIGI